MRDNGGPMPQPQYPTENGGLIVTLADIYHAQQDMTVTLAEIRGALALQSQQDRNDTATLADHESRIRKAETAQSSFITKAGALGLIVAVATVISCITAVLGVVLS